MYSHPSYWRNPSSEYLEIFASIWNSVLSPAGTYYVGNSPKCKRAFWKMTSFHYIIFTQFSRKIFCSVMENFFIAMLDISLSHVKAHSVVCVTLINIAFSLSRWLKPFFFAHLQFLNNISLFFSSFSVHLFLYVFLFFFLLFFGINRMRMLFLFGY